MTDRNDSGILRSMIVQLSAHHSRHPNAGGQQLDPALGSKILEGGARLHDIVLFARISSRLLAACTLLEAQRFLAGLLSSILGVHEGEEEEEVE
jgi:hypothetical protein